MFIDYTQIEIAAGDGGSGAVSFRREKFMPKGGPDGGDGGRGGHVCFMVDTNLHTLQDVRYKRRYQAENGHSGRGSNKTGKNGKDITILVPAGTMVRLKGSKKVIVDLTEKGQNFIICHGGQGGKGNARFKTAINKAPRKAQPGTIGDSGNYEIELKILADVGLVGLPNAGKSTLLSVLSSAKPKIADYEFTTLKPNLGIVSMTDYRTFVMADIPGIIEGASEGKGLGHYFLRHIERNSILLYVIPVDAKDLKKEFEILNNELKKYNPELIDKDFAIFFSKSDLMDKELLSELEAIIKKDFKKIPYFIGSSINMNGIKSLKEGLWKILN